MRHNNKDDIMATWTLSYYNAKVAAQVQAWPRGIRVSYLRTVEMMLAYGPNLGMPHTRAMGAGLFEIRAKGREGIGRAFYWTTVGERIIILHGFIKKTEQTPQRELDIALDRLQQVKV
jgi:phage-related protein